MRQTYAVFLRDPRTRRPLWALGTNRRQAHQLAQQTHGELRAMPTICFHDGQRATFGGWDAPTFYALSDPVADYRKDRL